ncbi:MAG: hypothetical protein WCS99_12890 [Limisphaerales bacterium]
MNDYCEQTIRVFGKRSSLMVFSIASWFALLGAAASLFTGLPLLWAAWIPLCFLVIPPLHFLCREFLRLQERVRELEKKLEQR